MGACLPKTHTHTQHILVGHEMYYSMYLCACVGEGAGERDKGGMRVEVYVRER